MTVVDQAENPYTAGFGVIPPTLAGRDAEFSDLEAALTGRRRGRYAEPRLITGDRGYGKTVLVAELAKKAREDDALVIDIEAVEGGSLIQQVAYYANQALRAASVDHRAGQAAKRLLNLLGAVSLRYGAGEIKVEPGEVADITGDLTIDTTTLLEQLDRVARENDTVALITIDEIQKVDGPSIAALLAGLQTLEKRAADPRDSPRILLVMTGLPGSRDHLRDTAGTYAGDRVKEHELGPLLRGEAVDAVDTPAVELGIRWSTDALERVVTAAGGYPYGLQLAAQGTWSAAHGHAEISDAAAEEGIETARKVMRQLFASRWNELPDSERGYLQAVASTAPEDRTSGGVARTLGRPSTQLGTRRRRLIEQRRLLREHNGRLVFTLPGFEDFVAEQP